MIVARLTALEVMQVALIGIQRRVGLLDAPDIHGYDAGAWKAWGNDIEGAAAEYVVARHYGKVWNALVSKPARRLGDVGAAEVRASRHPNGCLLLHESDPDDRGFILVVGACPEFKIVGWIKARDGKREEFWRTDTGRPAFFVPQSALTPIGREAAA